VAARGLMAKSGTIVRAANELIKKVLVATPMTPATSVAPPTATMAPNKSFCIDCGRPGHQKDNCHAWSRTALGQNLNLPLGPRSMPMNTGGMYNGGGIYGGGYYMGSGGGMHMGNGMGNGMGSGMGSGMMYNAMGNGMHNGIMGNGMVANMSADTRQPPTTPHQPAGRGRPPRGCYVCGAQDHLAFACPQAKR